MLVGVIAFQVLKVMDLTDQRALGVLLVGYFFQGKQPATLDCGTRLLISIYRSGLFPDFLLYLHLCHPHYYGVIIFVLLCFSTYNGVCRLDLWKAIKQTVHSLLVDHLALQPLH